MKLRVDSRTAIINNVDTLRIKTYKLRLYYLLLLLSIITRKFQLLTEYEAGV